MCSMTPAVRELEAAGVAFTVHEYERGESLRDFGVEAAEKLGLDLDQVFKTLLVTVDGRRPGWSTGLTYVDNDDYAKTQEVSSLARALRGFFHPAAAHADQPPGSGSSRG